MAKYHGIIGYGKNVEVTPGDWDFEITERAYYGDVVRDVMTTRESDKVLSDFTVGNSFSIMADGYAYENFAAMKFIEWAGERWIITNVEVRRPRLLIRIGKVYNGPTD